MKLINCVLYNAVVMVRVLLSLDALFVRLQSSTTRSLLMPSGIVESKILAVPISFVFSINSWR